MGGGIGLTGRVTICRIVDTANKLRADHVDVLVDLIWLLPGEPQRALGTHTTCTHTTCKQ